jgi:hypothetical protein
MKFLIALMVLILSFGIFSPNIFAACCVSSCQTPSASGKCPDNSTPDPRNCNQIPECNKGCCVGLAGSPFDPGYCASTLNRGCSKGTYYSKACGQIPECNKASMGSSGEFKGCYSDGINCIEAKAASDKMNKSGYRFYPKPCIQIAECRESLKPIGNDKILVCYASDAKNLILSKFASENTKLTCGEPKKTKKLTMRQIYSKGWKLIQVVPDESVVYYFEKK